MTIDNDKSFELPRHLICTKNPLYQQAYILRFFIRVYSWVVLGSWVFHLSLQSKNVSVIHVVSLVHARQFKICFKLLSPSTLHCTGFGNCFMYACTFDMCIKLLLTYLLTYLLTQARTPLVSIRCGFVVQRAAEHSLDIAQLVEVIEFARATVSDVVTRETAEQMSVQCRHIVRPAVHPP